MTKILGCLQPTYLPWIPFFERIILSDIFIILDDVEYSKNSNHNRNYIKNNFRKTLLTVPVKYKNRVMIKDIEIDNTKNWKKKHWETIKQTYGKMFFFNDFNKELEQIYTKDWIYLAKLNIEIIKLFMKYFKINTKIYISSKISIEGKENYKLINLCKYFGADTFIVKRNTQHYHPEKIFLESGIKFKYISNRAIKYTQKGNNFIPFLSILDYASNTGSSLIEEVTKNNNYE